MEKKIPKISVTMPVYNAKHYVVRAIESILAQTFKDFELLIVDDASTDGTLSVVEQYAKKDSRIRIVRNRKNLQIAQSLNKAVRLSRSDIIARMDADDISHPKRLKLQYDLLKRKPNVAIVGANMIIIDESNAMPISKREYPVTNNGLKKLMFRYSPFAHPVVMFRKKIFEEFKGYDKNLVPCEDINLWFKIGSKYDFATVPEFLLHYTLISTSSSHKKLKKLEVLGFKVKINAIREYGYRPSFYDILYNLAQFTTLWIMPAKTRIWLYNYLRSRGLI